MATVDLEPGKREDAVQVLSRAFFDDPLVEYITPDPDKRRANLPWFFGIATKYGEKYGGTAHTTPDSVQGAALWLPPGETITSTLRLIRLGLLATPFRFGISSTMRFLTVLSKLEHLHKRDVPPEHWYLWILGVEPERQGQGIGGNLIAPVLERADKEHLPCYLETMKERNVTFYQKNGFEVVVDDTFKDGPRYWTMRREPIG
ncbi:MAG: GNAT family N-acetyltransferase [Dehalococcoidia bacterium]